MKKLSSLLTALLLSVSLQAAKVTQFGTLQDLIDAQYTGKANITEMLKHGDFGLGTFDALDGEMVLLDGKVYQILGDGSVIQPAESIGVPFAVVLSFEQSEESALAEGTGFQALEETINQDFGNSRLLAVKVTGSFKRLHTRSVPKQTPPFKGLLEVVKGQSEFHFEDIQGTLVGYRFPAHAQGTNAAGLHFHFISADGTQGGHVLDFSVSEATKSILECSEWNIFFN